MGFFDGYNISTSGMSAQRSRINVVSANIANAKTTHTIDGGPYKKQNIDEKIYGMTLYDLNILWQVQANNTVEVISLNKVS